MKTFTQQEIDFLISCPKVITSPPSRDMKLDKRHYRNDFELTSEDEQFVFKVFMRKSEAFQENFSIGLSVRPKNEPGFVTILRYNGPHGDHVNSFGDVHPHRGYHIHTAEEKSLDEGLAPELTAHTTTEYASYEEALAHFIKRANVLGFEKHLGALNQLSLFNNEDNDGLS